MRLAYWIAAMIFLVPIGLYSQYSNDFFERTNNLLNQNVLEGKVNYNLVINDTEFSKLVSEIGSTDLETVPEESRKAFLINVYNLMVIDGVGKIYPTSSVQKTIGFFDRIKRNILGQEMTLNEFEKEYLLEQYNDPRLHFVLVCGALGCPPIISEAYMPDKLDNQLQQQTILALNDANFVRTNEAGVALSQIFEWYPNDFGGKSEFLNFVNQYREVSIDPKTKTSFYGYDWRLNDASTTTSAANAARYIVSSAIQKGTVELKIFNNLYSQQTGSVEELTNRSTFFTTSVSAIYGVTNRFNAGLEFRYRRVLNSPLPSSAFDVFQGGNESTVFRQGVTAIGPRVRFAPIPAWRNFSIQSTLSFPVGQDLAGTSDSPYIDWNGVSFNTQLFNDKTLGSNFSLFTELDFFIEDIGPASGNHANRFSTPVTAIVSYFPNQKTTLYALGGFSPFWQSTFDYFMQGGFGGKYQFTPNFEIELLYTGFTNKFLNETGGKAATYNIGIRSNF